MAALSSRLSYLGCLEGFGQFKNYDSLSVLSLIFEALFSCVISFPLNSICSAYSSGATFLKNICMSASSFLSFPDSVDFCGVIPLPAFRKSTIPSTTMNVSSPRTARAIVLKSRNSPVNELMIVEKKAINARAFLRPPTLLQLIPICGCSDIVPPWLVGYPPLFAVIIIVPIAPMNVVPISINPVRTL